jgi:DNA-binding NtrC family response regulator
MFQDVLTEAAIGCVCVDHEELPQPDGFTVVLSDLPATNSHYSSATARDWVKLLRERYAVPIVVITGRSEATHDGDLARDVSSIVEKPIGIDQLLDHIHRAHEATR